MVASNTGSYREDSSELGVARKVRGIAGVPGIKTVLTATTFPVYLARHLGAKSSCLGWVSAFTYDSETVEWGWVSWVAIPMCELHSA